MPIKIEWLAIGSFVLAVMIAIILLPAILRVARIKHLVATPNTRTVHQVNIPTLGGIAIFASMVIPLLLFSDFSDETGINFIIASIILLFFIGVKDDILVISVAKKLVIQILAAFIVIFFADIRIMSFYGILGLNEITFPYSLMFTLFVFIVIINAYNLIDGIDGLAAGVGIIISLTFGYLFYTGGQVSLTVMSLTLAGSLTGFLFYNFSRRNKIFMGDTGSLITGFMIGILAIKFIDLDHVIFGDLIVTNEPTVAILILAIPLFDALRMFTIRSFRRQSPFRADRSHLHHLLLNHGFSHLKISGILYVVNIVFIVLAFTLIQQVDKYVSVGFILLLFLIYCFAAFLLLKHAPYGLSNREQEKTNRNKAPNLKKLKAES